MGMEEENGFIRDKSLVSVFDRFKLKAACRLVGLCNVGADDGFTDFIYFGADCFGEK